MRVTRVAGVGLAAVCATFVAISANPDKRAISHSGPSPVDSIHEVTTIDTSFWQGFPTGQPRPVVVVAYLAQMDGFSAGARVAVLGARVRLDLARPAPHPPAEVLIGTGEGRQRVSTITARQAVVAWRTVSDPAAVADAASVPPVRLVRADFGAMTIQTDRGPLTVPAWVFSAAGGGTVRWPAVTPEVFWRAGLARPSTQVSSASVDASGRNLSITFLAGGGDPCVGTGRRWFTADAVVSPSLAVVSVGEHYSGPPAPIPTGASCFHLLYGLPQRVTLGLKQPLGGRVLVGPDGGAVPVSPA
jgi:hypothetical protein